METKNGYQMLGNLRRSWIAKNHSVNQPLIARDHSSGALEEVSDTGSDETNEAHGAVDDGPALSTTGRVARSGRGGGA